MPGIMTQELGMKNLASTDLSENSNHVEKLCKLLFNESTILLLLVNGLIFAALNSFQFVHALRILT